VNNQWFSKIAVWLVVALVLFTVFKQFDRATTGGNQIGYSDFLEEVRAKRIKSVTLQEGGGGTEIIAVTTDDKRLRSTATYLDRGPGGGRNRSGVKFHRQPPEGIARKANGSDRARAHFAKIIVDAALHDPEEPLIVSSVRAHGAFRPSSGSLGCVDDLVA